MTLTYRLTDEYRAGRQTVGTSKWAMERAVGHRKRAARAQHELSGTQAGG